MTTRSTHGAACLAAGLALCAATSAAAAPVGHDQNGKVIGAIGYSGGDDVACAKAGLAEMEKQLLGRS